MLGMGDLAQVLPAKHLPAALLSFIHCPVCASGLGALFSSLLGQKMGDNWEDDWILHT